MTTATLPPPPAPAPAAELVLTAADVALLPDQLATTAVKYELHDGRLVVMAPPRFPHGFRQLKFGNYFWLYGEQRGYGTPFTDAGLLLRRNPDHLVSPDVGFITTASLPPRLSPEGYLLTIPELVVEVRSKNNSPSELSEKVRDYLAAGVVLVWVADPDARTVTAHQPGQPPRVFAAADTLTADPVIPGFAVPVADLLPA